MFSIKNRIIGIVILAVLTSLFFFVKQFTVVKIKVVENYEKTRKKDSTSVATLSRELSIKDSLFFGSQDLNAIKDIQIKDLQTLNKNANTENKRLRNTENSCCAEVMHLENNGMIKHDTVFIAKINKVFKKDEWVEVPRPSILILRTLKK